MNRRAIFTAALVAVTAALGADTANAQLPEHLRDYPLTQLRPSGDLIAPFFDGWFANPDGSVTYEFGYMNRNTEEVVDIPLGEHNKLELRYADGTVVPAEFDGIQPTRFYVYNRRGFNGKRERGTFAVTVPDPSTEVVWTLGRDVHRIYAVPGRATSTAYELSWGKTAFGSLRPALRFSPTGEESRGAEGPWTDRVMASVGQPVTLSALVQDRGERYGLTDELWVPVRAEFIIHQGPAGAEAQFDPPTATVEPTMDASGEGAAMGQPQWGEVSTQATFTEPGEYVIRVRADNFAAEDSGFDYVCCWANGYIPVTVR
jgi:hypothetical protein